MTLNKEYQLCKCGRILIVKQVIMGKLLYGYLHNEFTKNRPEHDIRDIDGNLISKGKCKEKE